VDQIDLPPSGHFETTASKLNVVMEGFDPRTGRTTWSKRLGSAPVFADVEGDVAFTGTRSMVIGTSRGAVEINLKTGRSKTPAANSAFWCRHTAMVRYHVPRAVYVNGKRMQSHLVVGDEIVDSCDENLHLVDRQPSAVDTRAVGLTHGEFVVVATSSDVRGYLTP
jgi:hypothetical protein